MRFVWILLVVGCGGSEEPEGDTADVDVPSGIVAEQRVLFADCVSTARDAAGLVLATTTFDAFGWVLDVQRPSSSTIFERVREGNFVVSSTATEVFFDGSSKEVVVADYDAHQHTETVDGVDLVLVHDGDRLVSVDDAANNIFFEYDDCEYVTLLEASGFSAPFTNTYESGCLLGEVRTGLVVWTYEDGRPSVLTSDGVVSETTDWDCP